MLSTWRFAVGTARRTVVLAAALLAAAGTARLGFWQLDRADQKIALQDRIAARAELPPLVQADLARAPAAAAVQHYRRVTLRLQKGHFTADRHFGFEGAAWYWHFVDVVWLGLYFLVYWL